MERTCKPPQFRREPAVRRMTVPSWFASLICHGLLVFIFLLSLQHWDRGNSGAAEGDFREVGIYVKDAADLTETTTPSRPASSRSEENRFFRRPPAQRSRTRCRRDGESSGIDVRPD